MLKRMVMLIDDDEVSNFIGQNILQRSMIVDEVLSYKLADDALNYLKRNINLPAHLPKIIFLDINMPVKNGWDFLEDYRQVILPSNIDIPIIMLTSSLSQMDIEKAETYPEVKEFISKPLNLKYLKEIKNTYL